MRRYRGNNAKRRIRTPSVNHHDHTTDMNWSKVKTVTIIILVAVNIFFIINLRVQYVNTYLIDEKTRTDTAELLGKADILISPDIIPDTRPNVKVYENGYNEDYQQNIIKKITGSGTENCSWHMINNGTKCIINSTGDEFEFSDTDRFDLTYRKNISLPYMPDADYLTAFGAASETVPDDDSRDCTMKRCIERFLFSGELNSGSFISASASGSSYSLVPDTVRYDTANDWYVVTAHEEIDGCPLYARGTTFVIKSGEVIYMTGELMLLDPVSSYTTELVDQINILFEEKAYIEAKRLYDSPTLSADDLHGTDDVSRIISLSVGYCVSWNSDRTIFYLIPAWEIVYSDGSVRVRNAINGGIYAV